MKEILLTSSVLILALTVLRRFFGKHVSKRFQYGLWALVLLRLLIPVQFGSLSFSVTSLAQDSEPIAAIEHQISQPIAKPDYEVIYQNVVRDYQNQGYDVSKPEIVTQITQITEEKMALPTWEEVLKILWFAGMGAMAVWFTLVNLRFRRSARKNALRLDAESPIPVYVSEGVSTPCLTGLFRPVIYLTPACAEDPRLRRHALIHELTHFRHGDHIWSLLRSLCLCIYWFDPLVWLAAILSRRDCELACDEGALSRLGEEERLGYGRSLVDVVAGDLSPRHLLEAATAMNESKRQITERVNRIVKKPKFYLTSAICLLLAAALIAGCTFAGKVSKPEPQKSDYLLLETQTQIHAYDGTPEKVIWEQNTYDQYGHLTRTAKSEEGRITISKIECDAKGNVTKITNQDADGVTTTWSKLTYSNDGYLLSDWEYAGSGLQASEVQSKEYTYDENGNELTCKHSVGDFVYETVKTYDDAGNILSIAAGSSLMRYTYDSDGRLIHLVTYNNGKEERQEKYTYSDGGRTCTATIYDGSSVELGKTIQTKSADGRSVEVLMLLADGTEEQRTNSIYDEDGNCIFEQIFKQGRLYMTTVSRYCKPGQQAAYTLTYVPGDAVTDAQLYPFPGTAWGMTPEQVIDALKLEAGKNVTQTSFVSNGEDYIALTAEQIDLFGITVDVFFQFSDSYSPGIYRLYRAVAGLPPNVDFDALRTNMTMCYGAPKTVPSMAQRFTSPIAYYDLMTQKDKEAVDRLHVSQGHYTQPGNIYIELSENGRYISGSYQGELTNNCIVFNGPIFQFSNDYLLYSLSASDPDLLPFPGTDWSMTPDMVIDALELKEGEYSVFPPEDQNDEYILGDVYINLFGQTVSANFYFSDMDRNGVFHLYFVKAALPDSADFDALRLEMTECYGQPQQNKHPTWSSSYTCTDLMSPEDLQHLSAMSELDQQYFAETPASKITLVVNGGIFESSYNGVATDDHIIFTGSAARYLFEGGLSGIKQEETDPPIDDPTEPVEDDPPAPVSAQVVPGDFTAETLVTCWKELHLQWETPSGTGERFNCRIPMLYPFSNDAIAVNAMIAQRYGEIAAENQKAVEEGYSATVISIDYDAWLNGDLLTLMITVNTGYDYIDYQVFNFRVESGEYAKTMNTAAMAKSYLDLSYPEFLWAVKEFTLAYFDTEYGAADEDMLKDFKNWYLENHGMPMGDNPMNLSSGNLFMDDSGTMMLVFDAYSMAGADYYPTIAPFTPGSTDKAESYHWLFNIHADGAYATAHDNIFTNAFLANPKEFAQYVALEPEETIARVAQGIGFEGGVVYADTIREALNSLAESTFKTLTLETLDNHWPET